ncbi:cAMP-responsive element modulator-like [Ambystoma mexicanum]|uniref:cAMP-responsive element modulator-like n=1 Tax=Ambystoma mexicanum TaxID=8296 RepID=UPI0037E9349F
METVEPHQDLSTLGSVAESDVIHIQTKSGHTHVHSIKQVSGSGTSTVSPAVTVVQLPFGQTVQVPGVIQATQSPVVQSPQVQTVQVSTIPELDESTESTEGVTDSQKHREILSRRPYRKNLNELSSDVPGVPKVEEEKSEEEGPQSAIATMAVPTSIYQTSTGQYSM